MNNASVPRIFFESALSLAERTIRRLWILCIILAILLVATNGAWIWYESRYEKFETTEIQQDGQGVNIVGGGDVNYGSESEGN